MRHPGRHRTVGCGRLTSDPNRAR